jgi:two-component system, NarL family, sensor kinase
MMSQGRRRDAVVASRWRTAVAVTGTAIIVVGVASMLVRGRSLEVLYARWLLHNGPVGLMALWVGWLLLRRRSGHGLGRLAMALGVLAAVHVGSITLADARLVAAGAGQEAILTIVPARLPLDATLPLWVSSWVWVPAAVLFVTLLLALFPDGRLPGRGWRWVGPAAVAGAVLIGLAYAVTGWPASTRPMTLNDQPLDAPATRWLTTTGGILVLAAVGGTLGTLVRRWRVTDGEQRQQVRAVVIAGGAMALVMTVLWPWQVLWVPLSLVSMLVFLVTYAIAIARYRLHDLDVVLNRAVVATVLAALVTLGYLAIVVGIGGLVGRGSEQRLLPLVAVGVVALLFEPARRRVGVLVDRLLYGRDGDAHAVLSDLAARLRDAGSEEDLLAQVTDLLTRGTAADAAELVVTVDGRDRTFAVHGRPRPGPPVLTTPVRHHGATLGELRLHARSVSDLAPDAQRMLEDVAGTLGVLVANLRLRNELQVQVDELRRSRQRLVRVHDEARRALERDLHDGAQARLVALRIRLGLAAELADRGDGPRIGSVEAGSTLRQELEALVGEVDEALRGLRDLSRGIHPPALEGAGLVEALRTAVRGLPIEVTVDGAHQGRFEPSIETAVYFACLEAVQNAVKHGARRQVSVVIHNGAGDLVFSVEDDGPGWDPASVPVGTGLTNLADRIAALDGRVEVIASPGRGTVVRGRVPLPDRVSPAPRTGTG